MRSYKSPEGLATLSKSARQIEDNLELGAYYCWYRSIAVVYQHDMLGSKFLAEFLDVPRNRIERHF